MSGDPTVIPCVPNVPDDQVLLVTPAAPGDLVATPCEIKPAIAAVIPFEFQMGGLMTVTLAP